MILNYRRSTGVRRRPHSYVLPSSHVRSDNCAVVDDKTHTMMDAEVVSYARAYGDVYRHSEQSQKPV
jgi:hypothetical protein